ncbi:hypothetical protein [uncultured Pelagimonas sp.]|uniref:hypothetical protein n=1 Tax=uncultured Pelagimonas sp. TaxID=1618102 RepID=UPI002636B833|nr:hypothetical protein [uncultured Pelagimonas sp.]
MKHILLLGLLATAPFAAQAHHGPDLTIAQLQGGTAVSIAISQPHFAPALSQATTASQATVVAGGS